MKILRFLAGVVAVGLIAITSFVAFAWNSEIAAVDRPAGPFDQAAVKRGGELAAIGNCNVCHTAPGGKMFAGGLAIPTPFGTIYSTNITPDPETGIGRWSEAAFIRSMREGVNRKGQHLYPAFPYDHFTKVSDADNQALYAFLMTREAVRAEAPANELPFPLNIRLMLAGWKAMFLRKGPYQPDPAHDAVWNRGAYLAEGLGHCGACHTPRNRLGAEKTGEHFAGSAVEGWTAYAINGSSPSPIPWTADALAHYLKHGWQEHHGVSRGPMAPVTANMGSVPDSDVRAIAAYVASVMGEPSPERRARGEKILSQTVAHGPGAMAQTAGTQTLPISVDKNDLGAVIYAGACSSCHDAGRPLPFGGIRLAFSTALYGPDPTNPINVILYGLPAPEGERGPIMPGFAGVLNNQQMTALLTYLRAKFSDKPAWSGVESLVAKIRDGGERTHARAADGASSAPDNSTRRNTSW
ncbi:c-type cytochrome [Microvirga sp. M2]|uniref:c-type cytochrome n=1 Tax=Microvirga sp. M2 TaxID=3073270 RepID=UPI0039C22C23